MKTLAERLRWLAADQKVDQRTIGTRAGLSGAFFAGVMTRAKEDPAASIRGPEAVALSRAWGVTLDWLLDGRGPTYRADLDASTATRDGTRPERRNVPGWAEALAVARTRRAYDDGIWVAAGRVAALHTRGIIEPEDVLEVADSIAHLSDPGRPERQLLKLHREKVDASYEAAEAAHAAKKRPAPAKKAAPAAKKAAAPAAKKPARKPRGA